jgi:hypothetical protein
MLDIEDYLTIDNNDIVWYQSLNGEQLNFSIESTLEPLIYYTSMDKKNNHKLYLDNSQTQYQKERNTKWLLDINISSIFANYMFATLKKYRIFENVNNNKVLTKNVDSFIKNYINNNIVNRYKFKKIDFYIAYYDLKISSRVRYINNWNINLPQESLYNKYNIKLSDKNDYVNISFTQQTSSLYVFDYFYNILYEKI